MGKSCDQQNWHIRDHSDIMLPCSWVSFPNSSSSSSVPSWSVLSSTEEAVRLFLTLKLSMPSTLKGTRENTVKHISVTPYKIPILRCNRSILDIDCSTDLSRVATPLILLSSAGVVLAILASLEKYTIRVSISRSAALTSGTITVLQKSNSSQSCKEST